MNTLNRIASSLSETWRSVDGWPYEVSDMGRVWSEPKAHKHGGKILTPYTNQGGIYLVVDLRRDGDRWQRLVHRLVMEVHNPSPDAEDLEINHIDADPTNNKLSNLEWTEPDDNLPEQAPTEGEFAPVEEGAPF
jgi:hypothetical protein